MKRLVLLALLLTSCDNYAEEQAKYRMGWDEHVWALHYAKDNRTNLCFAGWINLKVVTLTNVPCTPEVLEQIAKDRKK